MAKSEPSNINQCVSPSITSRATNLTKDQLQRTDEVKNQFNAREGIYKASITIDHPGKLNASTSLSEPVQISLLTRLRNQSNPNSSASSRRSSIDNHNDSNQNNGNHILTDVLAFNVGRELIIYEFSQPTQSNFVEPIDHRIYKQNHQPTCHDLSHHGTNDFLHILVGFSKGQIQYINTQGKEQKVFNEGSYLDKSKVTCIKWLSNPKTNFIASYASGYLYVFDEQLNYQRDANVQPSYSVIRDEEKNFTISYIKNKSKQARNPIARWSIGTGSINQFSFSPDQTLLAVVSQDGFLRVFHYEKMELVAYMKSYFGGLLCVCWSPDGKYIATGGEDDFINLFSIDRSEGGSRVICRGHGHTSWISSISFDPFLNARNYYSSSSSISVENEENKSEKFIPTIFYRIGSVGQDNRLCLWDITEDLLKSNSNSKNKISSSNLENSTSNGNVSTSNDSANVSSSSTSKTSFSSLTSRLSFVRHSNKILKTTEENSDANSNSILNGASKKNRKLSLLPNSSKISSKNNGAAAASNADESNVSVNYFLHPVSSRRSNFDLTKTTFGTPLCPKLDDIQLIEPVVTEFISHERLNGIFFGETYLLTSSQDGIVTVWPKPQSLFTNDSTDDRTTLVNSNSHHSTVSQRL